MLSTTCRRVKQISPRIVSVRFAHTTSTPTEQDPTEYCKNFIRQHDYESFLIGQFWPKNVQGGYFALKAFSVELAMIQDTVSSALIGQMRMQFWKDAIRGLADGRPPRHPIALALHDVSQRAHLPTYYLKRIVDARDAELHTPTHLTMESLTSHAEATSSTLLYLLLSLLSLSSSSDLAHAASHLGTAQTLTTLLRALPYHGRHGRMVIPADITAKHGVSQEEVFRREGSARGISDAAYEFAVAANDHLLTAREVFKTEGRVPGQAMPAFLAGVQVSNFLGRLEKFNFDIFEPRLQVRDWRLPWNVWRSWYRKMF